MQEILSKIGGLVQNSRLAKEAVTLVKEVCR